MSQSYTYRFDCSNCGHAIVQTAPPDLKFALYFDQKKNELESDQYAACCAKCSKLIDAHNAPVEKLIHDKSVQNKKQKGETAEQAPKRKISAKPVEEKIERLPPAEQAKPDPMALIAGAIASLADGQKLLAEKLDQLVGTKEQAPKKNARKGR